jgi:hypothetical protein
VAYRELLDTCQWDDAGFELISTPNEALSPDLAPACLTVLALDRCRYLPIFGANGFPATWNRSVFGGDR